MYKKIKQLHRYDELGKRLRHQNQELIDELAQIDLKPNINSHK
jgi:hypothetical protein